MSQVNVAGSRSSIGHLFGNTAALVANDMVNRAITFVLYALIARYLGAFEFGQMSLTLTIFYLLQSLAPVGLKILLVRNVAREPERSGEYLVNGCVIAFISSMAALFLLLGFLSIMQYSEATVMIILLISLGLVPYSLSAVCESILQAHEKIRYITIANVPVSLIRGIAAFVLLASGFSLIWIGLLFIVSFSATFLLEWYLVTKHVASPVWNINKGLLGQIYRSGLIFFGMQGMIAVTGSILPLFISKSGGEVNVGLFNAANQMMAPIILVSQSTVMSLFPRMCQKYQSSAAALKQISERLIEILAALTLPLIVGLFFYARQVLLLVYDKEIFGLSTLLLQISVWILPLRAITSVLGRVLMASHRERTLLRIMSFEAVVTLLLALVFIPKYGLLGASAVMVIVGVLDLFLHIIPTRHTLGKIRYFIALGKSVTASLVMAGWMCLAQEWLNVPIFVNIFTAAILYLAVWLVLSIKEVGGWDQWVQRYRVW